ITSEHLPAPQLELSTMRVFLRRGSDGEWRTLLSGAWGQLLEGNCRPVRNVGPRSVICLTESHINPRRDLEPLPPQELVRRFDERHLSEAELRRLHAECLEAGRYEIVGKALVKLADFDGKFLEIESKPAEFRILEGPEHDGAAHDALPAF